MANLYFDESIRDQGGFIVGALVASDRDLSSLVRKKWIALGLDPDIYEFKSSSLKQGNDISTKQRSVVRSLLSSSKLALVVLPTSDRKQLGDYCAELVLQLIDTGMLVGRGHKLYVDEEISISNEKKTSLNDKGVSCILGANSATEAGIQLSDHASHALGGMLLEEIGIINKKVKVGENSGYPPDMLIELGFELWASLRYSLIGKQEYIEGLSPPPDDPANPYFKVDGYGLYISESCDTKLSESARKRFGINYLGCIH